MVDSCQASLYKMPQSLTFVKRALYFIYLSLYFRIMYNENFRINIKIRRKALGMTMQALADTLGVSKQHIYDIERGKDITFKLDKLEKICAALDCTPNDLFLWKPTGVKITYEY